MATALKVVRMLHVTRASSPVRLVAVSQPAGDVTVTMTVAPMIPATNSTVVMNSVPLGCLHVRIVDVLMPVGFVITTLIVALMTIQMNQKHASMLRVVKAGSTAPMVAAYNRVGFVMETMIAMIGVMKTAQYAASIPT